MNLAKNDLSRKITNPWKPIPHPPYPQRITKSDNARSLCYEYKTSTENTQ